MARKKSSGVSRTSLDIDEDLMLLEELLSEEEYEKSERRLYDFFINSWQCYSPEALVTNWHIECLSEHIQAALERKIRRLCITISPRCQVKGTQVNMADGSYKAIEEIEKGEYVISSDTRQVNTNKVLDTVNAGILDCVEIKLSDGNTLKVSKEHKIYTANRGWQEAKNLCIDDIVVSLKNFSYSKLNQGLNDKVSLEDAFLLGVWVAEGSKGTKGSFAFTNTTPEIIDKVRSIGESRGWQYRRDDGYHHRLINPPNKKYGSGVKGEIRKWMEKLLPGEEWPKNCYSARVPSCIFRASIEVKKEFINAFIACDGWVEKDGGRIGTQISSEELAKDIYRLFKQLGYRPTLKNQKRDFGIAPQGIVNCSRQYSCTVSKNTEIRKAKEDFNFYQKHINLESTIIKETSRLNDVPTCLIEPNKVDSKYRYRLRKSKWVQSTTLIEKCVDKEWLTSLNLDEFHYLSVQQLTDIGYQECFDLTIENDHTYFSEDILTHNSGKSTLGSIATPAYGLLRKPGEKFWLISHSARLYMQNIVAARRILEHPWYKDRWCNPENEETFRFDLARDVNTKSRVETSAGGYILGGSPTSTALGMGYTVAVIDDPLDSEQWNSPAAIDDVNNWYTNTFMNRSNDVNNDVVIILAQRLASRDLPAYVLDTYHEQNWVHLNLPAKYDPARKFFSPIGYDDRRTKAGELLDPVRLTEEFLLAQAKRPIIYNTRYQQNPEASEDGNFVESDWVKTTSIKPERYLHLVTIWDLSFTDSPKSSFSVGGVFALTDVGICMIDMWREQANQPRQVEGLKHMAKKYPNSDIAIEQKANAYAVKSTLQRELPNIKLLDPRDYGGSKAERLGSILPYMSEGKFMIYKPLGIDTKLESTYSVEEIKKELVGFPLAATDDIVDVVSYAVQYLMNIGTDSYGVIGSERMKITDEDYLPQKNSNEFDVFKGMWSREDIMNISF